MVTGERLNKWAPLISLGFGLIISFLFLNDTKDLEDILIAGIIYGLSASGLYSGTKATAHAVKGESE